MFPFRYFDATQTLTLPPPLAFSPCSKVELKSAVDTCLEVSPEGDCFEGPQGLIGEWDVSRVTDMSSMFSKAAAFDGDISTWDVSNIKDMSSMFLYATSFNSDISTWDVSRVITMSVMFRWGTSFNGDISEWDVSRVTNMDYMFSYATSFEQTLCGDAWVRSTASKTDMFSGSSGSISNKVCTTAPSASSKTSAVDAIAVLLHVDLHSRPHPFLCAPLLP